MRSGDMTMTGTGDANTTCTGATYFSAAWRLSIAGAVRRNRADRVAKALQTSLRASAIGRRLQAVESQATGSAAAASVPAEDDDIEDYITGKGDDMAGREADTTDKGDDITCKAAYTVMPWKRNSFAPEPVSTPVKHKGSATPKPSSGSCQLPESPTATPAKRQKVVATANINPKLQSAFPIDAPLTYTGNYPRPSTSTSDVSSAMGNRWNLHGHAVRGRCR
jgi:hypothetical protein